jgi:hypothetical protein
MFQIANRVFQVVIREDDVVVAHRCGKDERNIVTYC